MVIELGDIEYTLNNGRNDNNFGCLKTSANYSIQIRQSRLDRGDDAIALTREIVIIIDITQIKYVQID